MGNYLKEKYPEKLIPENDALDLMLKMSKIV